MKRREFLKCGSLAAAATALPAAALDVDRQKPNVILIVCDQLSYGLTKAAGFALDTCPTLDRLQAKGAGFRRNYCTIPACVPSRTTMLTGRWPEAHRVRMNLQADDAYFEKDIFQVARSSGYRTALIGKNHTYLKPKDADVWREYFHDGGPVDADSHPQAAAYDRWLHQLNFNVSDKPTPFPVEVQLPYRIVSDTIEFLRESASGPFFVEMSIPEPHDPEQVPAPYWDMFPPDKVPNRWAGPEALAHMGPRAQWEFRMQQEAAPFTEPLWRRYRSNYLGCLRMIDDQIRRLVDHLEQSGLAKNTVVAFTADHGDFLMNYGLGHKGVGLYETLIHTPLVWWGPGIAPNAEVPDAFTSMADLMPTLCEVMGAEIPRGVEGRSLWPLLQGQPFPRDEFRSIYGGVGVGGLYYDERDNVPTAVGRDPVRTTMFDELNMVTQSGNEKFVRMGDWKLVYDMMGYGELYNLRTDPGEMHNLFDTPQVAATQAKLMAELAMWSLRVQDSLPTGPQNRKYRTKWSKQHNWYAPYRRGGSAPSAYIP